MSTPQDIRDRKIPLDATAEGEVIRQLDSLLRGEISACETYHMAIDKLSDSKDPVAHSNVSTLKEIENDHGRAVQQLRARILELGGEPTEGSGTWGFWARTVQGTAELFGDASTLKSLKEGEEHGLKDYKDKLPDVDSQSAQLVQQLIPEQARHIDLLDQLIHSVGKA